MKTFILTLAILISICVCNSAGNRKNVCDKFIYYWIRDVSKQCWYDPNIDLKMPELVTQHGYPLKTYFLTTKDGYILQTFRLENTNPTKGVVYLQHALFTSNMQFVDKDNESIAFFFYDQGYDVWMGNSRGNLYSRNHTTLDPNKKEFWMFSYHEMGLYDIPTALEFIKYTTAVDKILFVGHSMAASSVLIYASLMPEHAHDHLNLIIVMAPAVLMGELTSPSSIIVIFHDIIYGILKLLNIFELVNYYIMHPILEPCRNNPLLMKLCASVIEFSAGVSSLGPSARNIPLLYSHTPAGISINTLNHFAQAIVLKRFAYYDYGKVENLRRYKAPTPPDYPFDKITTPIYIMYGSDDSVVIPKQAVELYGKLPLQARAGITEVVGYNHVNFAYGKYMRKLVYEPMLKFINGFSNK